MMGKSYKNAVKEKCRECIYDQLVGEEVFCSRLLRVVLETVRFLRLGPT